MNDLSVWELESFFAPTDIIIAGSGFVGLWSAYYLKKLEPKLSITILERGLIPTGASTRNAGFACFGSLTELISDADKMGEDKMLELVTMRYKGLRRINKLFSKKEIGFEHYGGYELIPESPGIDVNAIRSQIDRFNHLLKKTVKMQKTFRMVNQKIAEFGFAGIRHLIENTPEAQLHSGRLCQALLRQVQSMGVTVLNNIEIKGFDRT
ncbi:MAG TPA: FAD-dependent oxidoreductase, partial [Puia sp.]